MHMMFSTKPALKKIYNHFHHHHDHHLDHFLLHHISRSHGACSKNNGIGCGGHWEHEGVRAGNLVDDQDDHDGDDGDGDDGDDDGDHDDEDDDFNYCSSHHEVDGMFAEVLGDVREDWHLQDDFMTMRKGQPGALIREKHGIFPNYVPSPFQNMLLSRQGFFA